ncbi:hypothetical protein ARZXY2_4331 (plasmid) [Arthrobacter sp. ZXY-2]|nr:hypothetical protein ARZXY2_4331 [Arthrobacter sp. ZXY-2]
MFVHVRVLFALTGAYAACGPASLQHCAEDVCVGAGLTAKDSTRRSTNVGTIEIRTDARGQFGHHILTQTRVGTGTADLRAFKTRGDAFGQLLLVHHSRRFWVESIIALMWWVMVLLLTLISKRPARSAVRPTLDLERAKP